MDDLQLPSLAEFVRARRLRPTPDDPSGLSRQQLAAAIHSSVGYLAKIEQGEAHNPSPSVLDALAEALGLTPDERSHLYHLAQQHIPGHSPSGDAVDPLLHTDLDAMTPHPAAVLDRGWQILAGNAAFEAAFPGLPAKGNALTWMFTDPRARLVMEEWEQEADHMVGRFRACAARSITNDLTAPLLRTLSPIPDFRRLWTTGHVYQSRPSPALHLRNRKTGHPYTIHLQLLRTSTHQLLLGLPVPALPEIDG
ncbi:helix-turn-helix transcriptional regulator [Nocardia concava]|uniref:helix-turn-helix transcriptional regulator n=1 Tax=Nocardia concava TaxID=257281 RepID=UPI0002DE9FFA|nr:helix-turn-helix transcriptional regulator [Nocardia concava]